MKINELNQTAKVNEGALMDILIGPDAARRFSKDDDRHIEALKYFLKDFIGDATVSLSNGIQSGLIDTSKSSTEPSEPAVAGASAGLIESRYKKLNAIFESIVKSDGPESIAEYMLRWFETYMEGTNWKTKQGIILPIIKDIEQTYDTDKGRAAIEKLGRVAWDMLGKAPTVPAGAKDIAPAKTAAAPSSGSMSDTSQIISAIANLKKTNPLEFNKLAAQLGAIIK